jgi:hypothetical protein
MNFLFRFLFIGCFTSSLYAQDLTFIKKRDHLIIGLKIGAKTLLSSPDEGLIIDIFDAN